ncbi:taste receptor type 2 member 39-like [Latimeria chalumnae]|nr:PREDICTED: taste receptor type 2 member 39-like [Latimeria chalumnae]|eukprot:XP_006010533.1 PREDICTED: taste receptor type 2 member 39-like [Latimeria chalumnae]
MGVADIVQLGVSMILIGIGFYGNTFIILVFLLEYRKSQTLQPYELIVKLMSICSILIESVYIVKLVVYLLNFCTYFGENIYRVTDFFIILLHKTIIWLNAWLCFIYFVKIVKVNWRIFLRMKQRISLAVKFMIIGTTLLCFSLSFPVAFRVKFKTNSSSVCRQYFPATDDRKNSFLYSSMISILTSFLPLVLMLVSSLGIVIFLCLHSRNMDKNTIPNSMCTSRSDAHTSVAIMLLCLIALFIACTGTSLSVNIQVAMGQFEVQIAIALSNIIYLTGSPVILIIGMVKLRNRFAKLICTKG